ncbi:hypothetical protein GN244_ATG16540, partial [Phytophthora infestans]
HVLEKEVPRPVPKPAPTLTSATSEYWKRQLTGTGAMTTTATPADPVSANNMMQRGFRWALCGP